MTVLPESIFHLEPFPQFLRRVIDLNRLYNPEDPLHEALLRLSTGDTAAGGDEASLARKKLATIHKEFPHGAPLHEQAAYVVRAFNGLRPFAEANHRTGWDYLSELMIHSGYEVFPSEEEGRALGNEVWGRVGEAYPDGFGRNRVLDRDAVFQYLADWFRPRIA